MSMRGSALDRPGGGAPIRRALCALALGLALGLGGCETALDGETPVTLDGGPRQIARDGIKALQDNRLKDASLAFNAALKLDVRNSSLQFLNGFAYHLRAVREDRSLFPMAEQGYQLAIQFDESNWIARYHLGLLYLDQRDYAQARTTLADAMLYNDSDPELLYSLGVAAYYARDPVTAAGALTRLREVDPDNVRGLRASSLVMAALDKPEDARLMLARYTAAAPPDQARFLTRRLRDWEQFHGRIRNASVRPPLGSGSTGRQPQLAQGMPPDPFAQGAPPPMVTPLPDPSQPQPFGAPPPMGMPMPDPNQPQPFGAPPMPDPGQPQPFGALPPMGMPMDPNQPPPGVGSAQAPFGTAPGAIAAPQDPTERMVIVDVVIVSSEEDISTAKGVNLLSQLNILFGQATQLTSSGFTASNPAFSAVTSGTSGGTATTTITRAITIPAVNYSLNIANAGTNRNEILARPSLVATSGVKSEFFSGSNIRATAVSSTAQQGSIDVDKDIGVKLGVTPQFLDGARVRLLVEAERTFLQDSTSTSTLNFQLRTSKTTVNANVVMNLGETMILSGMSEKETGNVRSGVPGLQDIPVVQYFFSRQTTRDFNKSVLILITPRTTEYVFRPRDVRDRVQAGMSHEERVLSELQSRYSDWFRPYPNWASVFHHLQENVLYREFRTGDVSLERWESQTDLKNRLSKLGDFLYY